MGEEVKPSEDICAQCKSSVEEVDKIQCTSDKCKYIFHVTCSGLEQLGSDTWGTDVFQYWKCLDCVEIENRKSEEDWKKYDHKNTGSFRYHVGNLELKVEKLMEKYTSDKFILDYTMLDDENKINRFAKNYGKLCRVVEKMSELENVMGGLEGKINEKHNLIKELKMEFFLNDAWNLNEVSNEDSGSESENDYGLYESEDENDKNEGEEEEHENDEGNEEEDKDNENDAEETKSDKDKVETDSKSTQTDNCPEQVAVLTPRNLISNCNMPSTSISDPSCSYTCEY